MREYPVHVLLDVGAGLHTPGIIVAELARAIVAEWTRPPPRFAPSSPPPPPHRDPAYCALVVVVNLGAWFVLWWVVYKGLAGMRARWQRR